MISLFCGIVFACVVNSAGQEVITTLDSSLRNHLISLEPIVAEGLDSTALKDRVVVVNFFASWCPPCRDEFKALNVLRTEFKGRPLTIVGVNVFENFDENDAPRMLRFLTDTAPRFHVIGGTKETLAYFGDVDRIPTVLVFDRNGRQILRFIHARGASKMSVDTQELKAAIRPALGE